MRAPRAPIVGRADSHALLMAADADTPRYCTPRMLPFYNASALLDGEDDALISAAL